MTCFRINSEGKPQIFHFDYCNTCLEHKGLKAAILTVSCVIFRKYMFNSLWWHILNNDSVNDLVLYKTAHMKQLLVFKRANMRSQTLDARDRVLRPEALWLPISINNIEWPCRWNLTLFPICMILTKCVPLYLRYSLENHLH